MKMNNKQSISPVMRSIWHIFILYLTSEEEENLIHGT